MVFDFNFVQTLILFTQRKYVPCMIEIDQLVLEKKLENVVNVFSVLISPWKKVVALHLNQFEPPYSSQALRHVFFPFKISL